MSSSIMVIQSHEESEWMAAIRNELDTMETNQIWQFVDLPVILSPLSKKGF